MCFDSGILEIKDEGELNDEHRAQIINNLKAIGKELGLRVIFGAFPKVKWERSVNLANISSQRLAPKAGSLGDERNGCASQPWKAL